MRKVLLLAIWGASVNASNIGVNVGILTGAAFSGVKDATQADSHRIVAHKQASLAKSNVTANTFAGPNLFKKLTKKNYEMKTKPAFSLTGFADISFFNHKIDDKSYSFGLFGSIGRLGIHANGSNEHDKNSKSSFKSCFEGLIGAKAEYATSKFSAALILGPSFLLGEYSIGLANLENISIPEGHAQEVKSALEELKNKKFTVKGHAHPIAISALFGYKINSKFNALLMAKIIPAGTFKLHKPKDEKESHVYGESPRIKFWTIQITAGFSYKVI